MKIYFSFREMFSFVRPLKYAIFTMNITRVVTSFNEFTWLSVFLSTESFFYHLNLIPCHYWSWQRNIYFLVNIFVQHTFSMSKSSIKTKTILAMTDMTESTELLAFKRQKDLCVFVLFYHETNSKSSKIYLLATMKYTWCAYLSPPFTGINHYNL